ncbi:MAG: hypothetical protein ACP5XB_22695 [Isosphaeraceae bacterium]
MSIASAWGLLLLSRQWRWQGGVYDTLAVALGVVVLAWGAIGEFAPWHFAPYFAP